MSPITATTSKNSLAIFSISIFMSYTCVCGLDMNVTIPCSEANGIRTQIVVVNKTTLKSVFDTIYFNQKINIYGLRYGTTSSSFSMQIILYANGPKLRFKPCTGYYMHILVWTGLCPLHAFILSCRWYPSTHKLSEEAHFLK